MSVTERHETSVVDDDRFVRRPREAPFRQGGFDAVSAADGLARLAALDQHSRDLSILGSVVPGPGGCKVCRYVKNEAR